MAEDTTPAAPADTTPATEPSDIAALAAAVGSFDLQDSLERVRDAAPAADITPAAPAAAENGVEEFDDLIQSAGEDINEIDRQIVELQSQRSQLERERDALVRRRNELFPPPNQSEAIRAYLDQQQRNRANRAERLNALASLGVAVSPQAPIDAVRRRPTGYGNRPVQHPLVGAKSQQ